MLQNQKNLRGIIAMVFAMAGFVFNDLLIKLARPFLEAGQALFVRGLFALLLLIIWMAFSGAFRDIHKILNWKIGVRSAVEALIALAFVTALGAMSLADITAVLMLAPLFITLMSIFFFGEKVGWRRWSAIIVGFIGMLLVVQPGGGVIPVSALLLALFSALGVAMRDGLTRHLPQDVPSVIITLSSTLGTMAGGMLLMLTGQSWQPMPGNVLLYLAGAAFFVVLGNYCVIEAHRDVELSVVSPFRFSIIVWAVLLGIVVFGDWPTPLAFAGIALIGASGLYTVHRERIRRRNEAAAGS